MVKLVALVRRHPDLSREEFLHHWRARHAPLLLAQPSFLRFLRRYVQGVPAGAFAADRTQAEPFDGAAEMVFDSLEDMGRAFALDCYREVIQPDEARFLDLPRCVALVVEEAVLLDGTPPGVSGPRAAV